MLAFSLCLYIYIIVYIYIEIQQLELSELAKIACFSMEKAQAESQGSMETTGRTWQLKMVLLKETSLRAKLKVSCKPWNHGTGKPQIHDIGRRDIHGRLRNFKMTKMCHKMCQVLGGCPLAIQNSSLGPLLFWIVAK